MENEIDLNEDNKQSEVIEWLERILNAPMGGEVSIQCEFGCGQRAVQRIRTQLSRLRAQAKKERVVLVSFKLFLVSVTSNDIEDTVTFRKEEPVTGAILNEIYGPGKKERTPSTASFILGRAIRRP